MRSSVVSPPGVFELGQALRRRVWQPLHRMMEIFHVVPLTAAVAVFVLLAMVGQLHEIYLSYLEELKADQFVSIVLAALGLALISAAFYEAHYWLSTMRMNVIFSSLSNPNAGSLLHGLQRIAAFALALIPWLGLATGLLLTRNFLAERYTQLGKANVGASDLNAMQFLLVASPWTIAASAVVVGVAAAVFLDRYRRHMIVQHLAAGITVLIAILFCLLLTDFPLSSLGGVERIGVGLALAAAAVIYWFFYYWLNTFQTSFIYTQRLHPDTGINWRRRRRIALVVWALLPWVAIAFYFLAAPELAQTLSAAPASVSSALGLIDGVRNFPPPSRWAMLPVAMAWVLAVGLFVAMLLDKFHESVALQRTVVISIAVLMLTAVIASLFHVDTTVRVYRWIGPLGTTALELLFLFASLTLLSVLSQKSGFPALSLLIVAAVVTVIFPIPIWWMATGLAVVCGIVVVMAALSRLWAVALVGTVLVLPGVIAWTKNTRFVSVKLDDMPADAAKQAPKALALREAFELWLPPRLKDAATPAQAKYPVFVIAVEGGGIYAAAAASLFLAKLQDANPHFSRHVFAISGVSGGAIGATIFQSLARSALGSPTQNRADAANAAGVPVTASPASDRCRREPDMPRAPDTKQKLTPDVSKIMQDDHFSPVVGAIFPELLGGPAGRAEALEASFKNSVCSRDDLAANALAAAFVAHWSPSSQVPALVLNSTWVETGFRVAFAPFPLHATDESLYSFAHDMPGDKYVVLIRAAAVSARFPVVLPPYSISMTANNREWRWNFVDGGYSDNSGASTALAVHRALAEAAGERADIRLILLTSSDPAPDLNPKNVTITGTAFRDTVAPISAIMKVREGLGNQAVARACDRFYRSDDCKKRAGEPNAPLKIVEIPDQTYNLPLGWKLSHTTFEVVRWMLGRPELVSDKICNDLRGSTEAPTDEKIVLSNSCVLKSVIDLLPRGEAGRQ